MTAVSKTGALVEAINRSTKKDDYNKITMKGDFPQQDAFINDPNRYIVAQCSRRAGKTTGLAIKFFRTMEKHPKQTCLYLSITRESAKGIMWDVMKEIDARYKIGCVYTESKLEILHPNGAKLKLMGADAKDYRRKLKGKKFPGVAIDEAQDFLSDQLQALIDDSLTPTLSDFTDSWLVLTGTPGPVPQGYFFSVTHENKFGYSKHMWTMLENPHMPDPQAFIDDLIVRREWSYDHPSLRREYRNEWVLDTKSLWIQYEANKCDFNTLPLEHKWNYIMGVDIGFRDADAIAVLAWSETSKNTYLVEEVIRTKQGVSELTTMIEQTQKKYGAYKIVMDEGGLGKKLAEDLRQRFGVPLEAADKANKQTNVELLNDSMRLGTFKARKNSTFVKDSYMVSIDWDKSSPNKIIIKKSFHSDIIDSVLYAFRDSYGYTHKPQDAEPAYGSRAWAQKQQESMFEQALDHFTSETAQYDPNAWIKQEK